MRKRAVGKKVGRRDFRAKPAGLAPGTLVLPEGQSAQTVPARFVRYGADFYQEKADITSAEALSLVGGREGVEWVHFYGLNDLDSLRAIGEKFHIHPLTLEDILHTGQRAKIEFHDHYAYIVVRDLYLNEEDGELVSEQISVLLCGHRVISFQERPSALLEPILRRAREGRGRVRKAAADYLLYCLIDLLVDHYFLLIESMDEKLDTLEDELVQGADSATLSVIHKLKRRVIDARKAIWPTRELVAQLSKSDNAVIDKSTEIYFRDVYDHVIQIVDTLETLRDMLSSMLDTYLSSVSNRVNEVMKVLTIITSLFIPLSFIAGVYGMNFENMPELKWKYGYFACLGLMVTLALGMFAFFKRKRWI